MQLTLTTLMMHPKIMDLKSGEPLDYVALPTNVSSNVSIIINQQSKEYLWL